MFGVSPWTYGEITFLCVKRIELKIHITPHLGIRSRGQLEKSTLNIVSEVSTSFCRGVVLVCQEALLCDGFMLKIIFEIKNVKLASFKEYRTLSNGVQY